MIPPGKSGKASDPAAKVVPGRPIAARALNRLASLAESLGRLMLGRGLGGPTGGTPGVYDADERPFAALLSGTGNPYTATEVYGTAGGGWATVAGGRVVDAYEINGQAGLAGKYVPRIERNGAGAYVFQFNRFPSSCSGSLKIRVIDYCQLNQAGNLVGISGATVDLTDGTTHWTGTTDASGYVTLTGLPDHTEYSYTVTMSGYTTETVSGVHLACSGFSLCGLYAPRLCLTVTGCVGGVPVAGADVTITDSASGTTGSGTTDSDGHVCIDMPGVVIPAAGAAVPVTVEVTSPYAGLADASVTRILDSSARCGDYEMLTLVMEPAAGYVCCCPWGTPDTLHYSDDYGSATLTHTGSQFEGEYTFTCPCGADSVLCDAYGTRRSSASYAKSIRVKITVACGWSIYTAGTPGRMRFLVTRAWGALPPVQCDNTPVGCTGYPSTDWDDANRLQGVGGGSITQGGDTGYAGDCDDTYTFSLSGSFPTVGYHFTWSSGGNNTVPTAQQDCAATGFTITN